jgi:two-component system NarL family sensor kinase
MRTRDDYETNEPQSGALPPSDNNRLMQLAGDLHDGLLQYVIAARMMNEVVRNRLRAASTELPPEVELVEHYLQQAIAEGRRLIERLHGGRPAEIDLAAELGKLVQELSEEGRVECEFHLEGAAPRDAAVVDTLFRVAQESLSNIRRHSRATWARVSLIGQSSRVQLEVMDNGAGFDAGSPRGDELRAGVGLAGMRRRVEAIGGRCQIESSPSRGTRVQVELPLNSPM